MFSSLAIHGLPFLTSVLLLWVPIGLLMGKGVHYRELDAAWHPFMAPAVFLPWHWFDVVRIGAATFFLCDAVGFSRSLAEDELTQLNAALVVAITLAVGVVLQTVVCRAEGGFHVPFTFVLGAVAVLYPPAVAALVLVVAVTAAIGFRSLAAFLWALPVGVLAIGGGLYRHPVELSLGAGLGVLAAILPLLFHRHWVFAHRRVPVDPEALRDLR